MVERSLRMRLCERVLPLSFFMSKEAFRSGKRIVECLRFAFLGSDPENGYYFHLTTPPTILKKSTSKKLNL
jgi:hypothetical protein